jgi:hypothetical protein
VHDPGRPRSPNRAAMAIACRARTLDRDPPDFRTIQAPSKDLGKPLSYLKRTGVRGAKEQAMSDRLAERSHNAVSDIVELAFYSISVLLVFLLWVYVPA